MQLRSSHDPEAHSVRVYLHGGAPRKKPLYHISTSPGETPVDVSLLVDAEERYVWLDLWELMVPALACPDAAASLLEYETDSDRVILTFGTEVAPTAREVPFDWPEDEPEWYTTAELDSEGRLQRLIIHRASLRCYPELLERAADG